MKKWIAGIVLIAGVSAMAGTIGLPREKITLPKVQSGSPYLVCVWDVAAGAWLQDFVEYDNSGSFELQIPEWGDLQKGGWYWVGLWDSTHHRYVFGEWIGHFKTN